jgi:hypothetical protein
MLTDFQCLGLSSLFSASAEYPTPTPDDIQQGYRVKSAESAMGWWTMTSDEGFAAQEAMAAVKKVKMEKAASSKEVKAAKSRRTPRWGRRS